MSVRNGYEAFMNRLVNQYLTDVIMEPDVPVPPSILDYFFRREAYRQLNCNCNQICVCTFNMPLEIDPISGIAPSPVNSPPPAITRSRTRAIAVPMVRNNPQPTVGNERLNSLDQQLESLVARRRRRQVRDALR